jgi:hypothetical protein
MPESRHARAERVRHRGRKEEVAVRARKGEKRRGGERDREPGGEREREGCKRQRRTKSRGKLFGRAKNLFGVERRSASGSAIKVFRIG